MTTDPPLTLLVEKKLKGVQHIIKDYCQHIHSLKHGGDADTQPRDLRAQLLEAEAAHFSKTNGASHKPASISEPTTSSKRHLEAGPGQDGDVDEDIEAKRRRVLEESRDIDADSDNSSNSSSDEDSDDEEDETAELLRELEKIKKERAEKQAQEERVKAEAENEDRERDIALGNPLLNPHKNNETKRRHVHLMLDGHSSLTDSIGGTTM
ncbi:MAG: hypothetical protein LQ346_006039 [Caloplaca aetnensis]|nr:MAG: hypothetical protein LQ346_006039 [Caloplaca aetnensis]